MARLMTVPQYAAHRGTSRQAVHQAIKRGRIKLRAGMIDQEAADRDWLRASYGRAKTLPTEQIVRAGPPAAPPAGEAPNPQLPSLVASSAMRMAWAARLARLDYERKSGQLVEVAEVKKMWFEAARRARDLLMAVPDRVAPLVTGMKDQHAVHRAIKEEIERAVKELQSVYRNGTD
ncbi:MAG TPA: hypothetical protein VIV56_16790 [Gemmatimonadales bacterium]